MRKPAGKRKNLNYPKQTNGSRLAARIRRLASKLTPQAEAEHFGRGMAKSLGIIMKNSR
jgi:hypothetical protein